MKPLVFALLLLSPAAVIPVSAQSTTVWAIRVEGGQSVNHDGEDESLGGAIRVLAGLGSRQAVWLEGGLLAGMPYLGVDGGVELRLPLAAGLALLGRGGAGALVEESFAGLFVRGGGGVRLALGRHSALSATYQRGMHGEARGPDLFMLGLELRLGPG